MDTEEWVVVYTEYGRLSAEIVRILFESRGIPVFLAQEGAGAAYGFTVGPLGSVNILVPESHVKHARLLLDDLQAGRLEITDESYPSENKDSGDQPNITKA